MPHKHTIQKRRGRLATAWSVTNAQLGGARYTNHPVCRVLWRYHKCAPYGAITREWARFMEWYKAAVTEAYDRGSSWTPWQ